MGKYALLDSPQAAPGSCKYCGSSSRQLFIDTGTHEEFHGRVYICVDECLREMVQLTGFITPEQSIILNQRLNEALTIIEQREKTIRGMEQIINGYQLSFDDFLTDDSDPRSYPLDVEPVSEPEAVSEQSSGGEPAAEVGSETGEADSSESDSKPKLAGLRSGGELPNLI